jgi:hypothetical protein
MAWPIGQLREIADMAEEVGRLHDDAGDVLSSMLREGRDPRQRASAGTSRSIRSQSPAIGLDHLAVMRMQAAREHDALFRG